MAITDPEVIRFCNEVVRPLSEDVRDLLEDAKRARSKWTADVAAKVPNDALEVLEDGREAQGVSRLTGQEISAFMAVLAWLEKAANEATTGEPPANLNARVQRPTVRTLRSTK